MTFSQHRPRVAVIGSGLAGLTTAYLLRLRGVTVYLVEKSEKVGFHSSSIDIPSDHGDKPISGGDATARTPKGSWTVDVPMRSFQGGYYPNLIALYRHLEIPLVPTHFTFSFSHFRPRPFDAYFIHSGASGHSIPSFPSTLSPLWSMIKWISFAGCYVLLLALAALSYHSLLPCLFGGTLGETVDQIALFLYRPIPYVPLYTPLGLVWRSFIAQVVVPLFSSVGTMPESDLYGSPASAVLDYIHLTVGTDHYALAPGRSARTVAERLSAPVRAQGEGHVRLGATVQSMRYERDPVGTDREVVLSFREGEDIRVDRVVLATPASVARSFLGMLEDSLDSAGETAVNERLRAGIMKKALAQVRYKETIVITHRDSSVLPTSPRDVRDINLVLPTAQSSKRPRREKDVGQTPHFDPGQGYTMATHVIQAPRGYGQGEEAVYQTTNPIVPIRPGSVLGTAKLERALPLRTPSATIPALQPGPGLVYLAGAYAWPGIPLLEGCVGSAKRAVDALTDDLALAPQSHAEGEVDWSQGRGSLIGRIWRWRRRELDVDVDVDT